MANSELGALEQLKKCVQFAQFRKLLAVRLLSQVGDGMFQAGLAMLIIFNPQSQTTAADIASAFAILLLPFTLVGPFAGPLLDRWRRRQVLFWGNVTRMAFAGLLSVLVFYLNDHWLVYVFALATLGVNRFLLSALSAGLPHTLPRDLYVMANSITPTLGSIAAAIGALTGVGLNWLVPDMVRNSAALVVAGLFFAGSSLLSLRFKPEALGPDDPPRASLSHAISKVLKDLYAGAQYLIRRGTPAYALGIMAIHRFLYGVNFVALILISRNLFANNVDDGLAQFAFIAGISFVGNGLAIVTTPVVHQYLHPARWIMICLGISAASQLLLAGTWEKPWIYAAAILLGFGIQGAKIAVDSIVQRDTADAYRGRAFSLYDMLFNAAFVGAAFFAAYALPDSGWDRVAFSVLTGMYFIALLWFWMKESAVGGEPRGE